MKKTEPKYMGRVKVGAKGQIVIPKDVRDMFQIQPGDTLLLLAKQNTGIAIQRFDFFEKIADTVFEGNFRHDMPDPPTKEETIEFAKIVRGMKPSQKG